MLVYLGAYNISQQNDDNRIKIGIFGVLIHDGWDPNEISYDHDIALLKTNGEVQFNQFVRPICLPNDQISRIKNGIVAGYGLFNESSITSDVPVKVELSIMSVFACFKIQQSLSHVAWEDSFCAGRENAGVCPGDSGSGLYVEINGRFYLKGIVSSLVSNLDYNCTHNNYAIFSDIQKYQQDFIKPVSISS